MSLALIHKVSFNRNVSVVLFLVGPILVPGGIDVARVVFAVSITMQV